MRCLILLFATTFPVYAQQEHIAPAAPLLPEQAQKKFKVPPGFEVQLVASEPTIGKPMQMAFDAKGRLWVTSSNEYPFAAKERAGKDKIYILEDFDAHGKAQKVTTFAEDLNIPIGILPLPDCKSCIVYSIPYVWKLTDTQGTGKADKKEHLYGPFGFRDTHGMVNSFVQTLDGWVHACHGFSNDSSVKGTDGQVLTMNSGSTFRFRPDGTHLEIWTRGQVNPFGMTMDPYGQLYNADCHSRPITQLIHNAVYSSFGKPHDGLGYGPDMIRHDHGSTALCGLTWLQTDTFPPEYQNSIFLGNVVTNRVHRDALKWSGSSPEAVEQQEFMMTDDQWFRPADIKLGLDGALYVSDFYNRIIGHYEVALDHPGRDRERGRIWRIVPTAKPLMDKTDLTQLSFEQLIKELDSSNIVRRQLAAFQVIQRGRDNPALASKQTLAWNSAPGKRPATSYEIVNSWKKSGLTDIELSLNSADSPEYRARFLRNCDLKKYTTTIPSILEGSEAFSKRAILENLTVHPDTDLILTLRGLIGNTPSTDSHMKHAARIALREALLQPHAWEKQGVPVLSENRDAKIMVDVCLGAPTEKAAAYLVSMPVSILSNDNHLIDACTHIARYGTVDTLHKLHDLITGQNSMTTEMKLASLQGVFKGYQQRGRAIDGEWISSTDKLVTNYLKLPGEKEQLAALDLAATLKLNNQFENISNLVENAKASEPARLAGLSTLGRLNSVRALPYLILALRDSNWSIPAREKIAQQLGQIPTPDSLTALGDAIRTAPSRLDGAIAQSLAGSKPGAEILFTTIEKGSASPRLLLDKAIQDKLGSYKERIAKLTAGLPSVDQKIQMTINQRKKSQGLGEANFEIGKSLFTKHCGICHQIAGVGAKVGPNLDGIGNRGLDRLLEDVLDPNRNVDAAFRMTTLFLKDGKTLSGLVVREEGQSVVIADQTGKETAVGKDNIEERKVSNLSPMPANIAEQVSESEFRHLMGYLLKQKKD
ncbi:c-type cytochrome [Telmatocola sphagniphila]|uniref:C-type cytochrome n=1 Tax=Telmatocola sphagniphila TaxID=1123043 RepID=A0A8E6B6C1_9BACT|nr:PVC-type heme-binding CxxCH protein [Telmatocola sphagniphila]QVL31986.1 c-type cytochrome [Telmatocola sphagniphila]